MKIETIKNDNRPSWDVYFSHIAQTVASRASCPRLSVGCVIVKENRILVTGYNGSPPNASHCLEAGCFIVNNHCERTLHAEANAIAHAAKNGIAINDSTVHITHFPCSNCMKLIVATGITEVVYTTPYENEITHWWAKTHNIIVRNVTV